MSNRAITLILLNVLIFNAGIIVLALKKDETPVQPSVTQESVVPIIVQPDPINYKIDQPVPEFLQYGATLARLRQWHEQAPKLTEIGTYGKSSKGSDLFFFRITNPEKTDKKVVLITACIHGNEPLSASTVMGYIGTVLDKYGDDPQITELVDTRDLYFVPIVSPDSYPNSRQVDGVDPNRNFPTRTNPNHQSVPPVKALQQLFSKIKPQAVISGHTYGRIYLTPWGDQNPVCPNEADYQRIVGEMARLSQYRMQRACQMYGRPIYGTEVDWYYRNGAMAIVMEFGTHQSVPARDDIEHEFNRTFGAVLFFIKEAPMVEIKQQTRVRRAA